jgi:hypothetical protein
VNSISKKSPKSGEWMKKLLSLRPAWMLALYILVDVICIGMGMGVPFFCILLGFIVGGFVIYYLTQRPTDRLQVLRKALFYAGASAGFTFLAMLALWGPFAAIYLSDPTKDLANTGIPLILFEPRASLIGWTVLMVVISPFLQLLAASFSATITWLAWMKKAARVNPSN